MKRKKFIKKYKNNILEIKLENFIKKFNLEKLKLKKFLNLKQGIKNSFNYEFSKNNVYKAKNFLSKKELNLIQKELSNYLQW